MKINLKKLCAVVMCVALLAGIGAVNTTAGNTDSASAMNILYDIGDVAFKGLLKIITILFPPIGIPREFSEGNFLPGMTEFKELPADPSYTWKLGYAQADLLEGLDDAFIKTLAVSGILDILGKRTVSEVLDPPMARVTALSDGSGNGTVLFVSIDGFGISSVDVGRIRAAVKDFANENNIVSINVSALHQHSTVDTLGMNGNLLGAVFCNTLALATGWFRPFSGKNPDYMKHATDLVAEAIKKAVNGMEEGTLNYSKADASNYIRDKRTPEQFDPYLHRLRFVPANAASAETWLCNAGIHTTGMGVSGTVVSSDFPHFMGEAIKEQKGANFQFINGAELAIGMDNKVPMPEEATGYQRTEAYGNQLAQLMIDIPAGEEQQVPALLNVAHKEYVVPIDNPLHVLFYRLGVIEYNGRKTNWTATDLEVKTELGYMELGDRLAFAFIPGELEPMLAFGGSIPASESYTGEAYEFTPLKDMVGGRELMVFGLTNDQVGYMLLPNDIAHFVVFGNEEVNASSTQLAPKTLEAFKALTDGVN